MWGKISNSMVRCGVMSMCMELWTHWPLPRLSIYHIHTHTHTNWQNYAEIYHFSVLAINHLSEIVRLHTCMSSPHIYWTRSVGSWHRCLNAIMAHFFPIICSFCSKFIRNFFCSFTQFQQVPFWHTHTHTTRSFIKNPLHSFVYTQHSNSYRNVLSQNVHTILCTQHTHSRKKGCDSIFKTLRIRFAVWIWNSLSITTLKKI